MQSIVEKPKPEDAPSTWGVMGRYVFTPAIFESIDRTKPGAGGEIQLTDAIGGLLPEPRTSTATRSTRAATTSARSSTTCGPPSSWPWPARTSAPSSASGSSGYVREQGIG